MSNPQINNYSVVVALGLYRSASTWMFNVIKSIISFDRNLTFAYAEDISGLYDKLSDNSETLLVKTHNPDPSLQILIKYSNAKVILTIREPLDCVASLMRQFYLPFEEAIERVDASCTAILALKSLSDPEIFIYEKPSGRNADDIMKIAEILGVYITKEQCEAILQRYSPESVKEYISKATRENRFDERPPAHQHDAATLWHPRHVGDGRAGLHIDVLDGNQINIVKYRCRSFRYHYGYSQNDDNIAVQSGSKISFTSDGLRYCYEGFSKPENWGIWTDGEQSLVRLPLTCNANYARIQMLCILSADLRSDSNASISIDINGHIVYKMHASENNVSPLFISSFIPIDSSNIIELKIVFENLRPNSEIDESGDTRKLGLGLIEMQVEYT